ncbi:MAG: hypothetical protein UX85_C0004G0152 [Candidatus Beckwithbacteria bacterium GW2011_GWB1_47_15]|uniref:Carbohydrate kinase PfkB domain-containing protein n=1 Tax=Candidatus Beckwithbacteria bacterium GW2011_GWB1_47_15 TaxID=1618371 RepID=A0A0G1UU43_9BACT|nr:MAG: PfkB domain-containing protein, fructoselysine 6-kinase [Candidatus Beckwithbacteria bacterium GW2011_GWC1_49_16]KKU35025.1 MAG: hypothetical protein UX50_C0007G0060 [Candidatus Beckwithbacteria bacterium GW2011_GWA1_46_30]KKU61230.1 MAG: hypothetical protein UX85_C0004G0152 [Candidatus Beckwithbacteria bacterium GW2011_GWB1_47_15]KKU71476.1 MAG: hypothetical protein UX97_C0006G0060 [Candidatus Beckwithbacteria bacterium GW2011_GWA2_47_25]KKW03307.1 MAG: hypothetical protein UY37_C0006G
MVKIASIGDCVVDVYPQQKKHFLGGTAFNRAVWLAQNDVRVSLVSAVGNDTWGKKYLDICRKLKINITWLSVIPGPTSHINITLDRQKRARFSAWKLEGLKNFRPGGFPQSQDALITTGFKPIKQLMTLPASPFTAIDFDGHTPYTFSNAAVDKFASAFDLVITSRHLTIKHHPLVLTTLGSQGSRVVYQGRQFFSPAPPVKTQDTTGAGDVYIASFVLHYLKTKNIPLSMKRATSQAAEFISQPRSLSV